jgi:hypothetical protein
MSALAKGTLVEFNLNPDALVLPFQYNPETMTRTRGTEVTINNTPGTASSFAFASPMETSRIMQTAKLQDEILSVELIFAAGDYADRDGFNIGESGIQPVLDSLRLLVEPRSQKMGGLRMMNELGLTGGRAFDRDLTPSVVLFIWGAEVLPVVMKTVSYTVDEFLPSLAPIKCTAQLSMQVIEAHNPFIFADRLRQHASAAILKSKPGFNPASELIKRAGG